MNIFKKFWNWLKGLFVKNYKKEQFTKDQIMNYLDTMLPKKDKFSFKDIIDILKKFFSK